MRWRRGRESARAGFRADAMVRRLTGLATAALAVAAAEALVFRHFFEHRISLVWEADGLAQHFPALYHTHQILSAFLRDPLAGIAQWSWQLGFGADVIGTLSYYIADPFAWLSVLMPLSWTERAYFLIFLIRILAAGIAGYLYLRKMRSTPFAAVMGTLVYVFGMYLMWTTRHPYFVNGMVWFPLILLGIEKVLDGRRWYLLPVAVGVLAASNFYLFYQVGIVTILYAVLRWYERTPKGEHLRSLAPATARVGGAYALGFLLAAGIVVPVFFAGLASTRVMEADASSLLQGVAGYKSFLVGLAFPISGSDSAYMGYSILAFMLAPLLFVRPGRDLTLKAMLLLFPITLVTPLFGKFMNALEFPSYRFLFMWGLFLGGAVARVLSERPPMKLTDLRIMAVTLISYLGLGLYGASGVWYRTIAVVLTFVLGALMWSVLAFERRSALRRTAAHHTPRRRAPAPASRVALAVLVLAGIAAGGAANFDPDITPRLESFLSTGSVLPRFTETPGSHAASLTAGALVRVENQSRAYGLDLNTEGSNDQLIQDYKGVTFYFSIMDDDVYRFVDGLHTRGIRLGFDFSGLDERAALESLLGVKYFIAKWKGAQYVPYGFEVTGTAGTALVYENRHALPFAFVYHSSIPRGRYETLSPLAQQQVMLDSLVIEGPPPPGAASASATASGVVELTATMSPIESRIDTATHVIAIRRPGGGALLEVPSVRDAELYVHVTGIEGVPVMSGYLGVSASTGGATKTDDLHGRTSPYYHGNDSSLMDLGYFTQTPTRIALTVSRKTAFHYADIRVYAVPMGSYAAKVAALADEGILDVVVATDTVSGTFTAKSEGVLFMSIPHSTGWTATVDGRPTPVMRANVGFSGIAVKRGTHRLVLRYKTPGLRTGLAISLAAVIALLAGVVVTERRLRRGSAASEQR